MKCEKCGFDSADKQKFGKSLCQICNKFSPDNEKDFQNYINEKIDWQVLETFRKFHKNKNIASMQKKAKSGQIMSRAAFGYKMENKKLLPDEENKLRVQKIFMDFVEQNISLNKLAKKHGFSVNGLKKILRNFTYIGKTKFNGQIHQGNHQAIISPELFNKVQNKLEDLEIK